MPLQLPIVPELWLRPVLQILGLRETSFYRFVFQILSFREETALVVQARRKLVLSTACFAGSKWKIFRKFPARLI